MNKLRALTSVAAIAVASVFAVGVVATPVPALAKKAAKKAAVKAEPKEDKKPMSFDAGPQPLADMSGRADTKREETIRKLKALIPTLADGNPGKPIRMFQLAEEYWKKSRYIYITGMDKLTEQLDAWAEAGSEGKPPSFKALPEHRESRVYKAEALKLYRKILKRYPKFQNNDRVYYAMASAHLEAGEKKKAARRFRDLTKYFPKSDFAADAYLQLGEYFFNSGSHNLTKAIGAYKRAARSKKARIYSFALYKLAWCDYNLNEYENSLAKFKEVVAYSLKQSAEAKKGGKMSRKDQIQLIEEALSDMVRTYSHLDAVDDAFEYYVRIRQKTDAYDYLRRLGDRYMTEGKYAVAVKMFRKLNEDSDYQFHEKAPFNQASVMRAFAQLDRKDDVRREARRMIELYSPSTIWAEKNAENPRALSAAFERVEQKLGELVTEKHKEAQETKLVSTYELARDLYKDYLDKFPSSPDSYQFRFFYSEILFELKQFGLAAPVYDMVSGVEGKFQKDAAYASILSWEKVLSGVKETLGRRINEGKRGKRKGKLRQLEKLKKLKKGQSYEPKDLTATEVKLAAACDHFTEIAPEDDGVVNIKFKSAQIYYLKNHFDEASVRFGEIIDKWPQHKYGRFAAELIVESYNVREDWSQLNVWARKFAKNPRLMADKKFAKTIGGYVEGASFQEIIKVFEPAKTQAEIANHYVGFATEFPKSKYAMIAVFNAVVNYDKANQLEDAIAQAQKILTDFKDFKLKKEDITKSKKAGTSITLPETIREKTMFLVAGFHGRLAQFEESATLYEAYSTEFKKAEKRGDAVYNSAVYREGLGQYDAAIANYKSYMKEFPKKDDIPVIDWRIGELLVKKGEHRSAQGHFGNIVKSAAKRGDAERSVCAEYKVMEAQIAQGRERDTERSWNRILASFAKLNPEDKAKPCPLKAAGYITFSKLAGEYEKYLAINFSNERTIVKDVPAKKDLLGKLEGEYLEVIKLQQPDYAIAALFRLAKLQQNMALAFQSSPCPKKLTEDQCAMYEGALLEQSYPYEENAIAGYDKVLAKAYELQLYNEWLIKAQEGLKQYEPGRFPEIRKYALIPSEAAQQTPKVAEAMK